MNVRSLYLSQHPNVLPSYIATLRHLEKGFYSQQDVEPVRTVSNDMLKGHLGYLNKYGGSYINLRLVCETKDEYIRISNELAAKRISLSGDSVWEW